MTPTLASAAGDCAGCPREALCRGLRDGSLHLEAFGRACRGPSSGTAAAAALATTAAWPHHSEERKSC